jgi:hypothetical protein
MNSGLNLDLFDLPMCDVGCVELSTFLYLIVLTWRCPHACTWKCS